MTQQDNKTNNTVNKKPSFTNNRKGGFGGEKKGGYMKKRDNRDFKEQPKDEFESKLLDLARVTKVTGGGKNMKFRAVIVVGDRNKRVGVGVAKGLDVSQAIEKATRDAKNNIIEVPMVKGTIPCEVEAKYGPSRVLLKPQTEGRGLVAGGAVRVICSLAGIKDVSSKILSTTTNKLNNARATMSALSKLKSVKK
ncbi:MAG: 30S ribosomal protein S5 [Candidatus Pacebacteria bacterium]|nr:30S ribosomal protein S5 [Candidatus Paceibacterota bacterium]